MTVVNYTAFKTVLSNHWWSDYFIGWFKHIWSQFSCIM